MRQHIAAITALAGTCLLVVGCTKMVDGNAIAADTSGPLNQTPIPVSALDNLLLDTSEINTELGATSMKVWFNAKAMWDWSQNVADKNCLAVDGPAQDKVYAGTGWTAMRGQRLDDSVDDSKNRKHYAIQTVVAFPSAKDANSFYDSQVQSWNSCSNRRFNDVSPNQPDTVWTVAAATNNDGTLSTSQVQEGGDGWACQRALTVRNNIAVDVVTCAYSQKSSVATDIVTQIAAKIAKQ
ncbi:sensor domain-containing protein [Mycobacterium angelicum]|uniref:PknH-like extracellular domain-containing protein n=1 Tax=Mycobacterium angelicum TaxID=470074 RepID=A0A1W9ZI81_MYCAN|nr:sensor domain-containing protein [Mycobacterium angelicum]MCV7199426.1 sensor domain-containing protein [Mycobacterium angelicum]ORA16001.1 hypothetical protein BST12_21415 [Mycobacterium angelicum]